MKAVNIARLFSRDGWEEAVQKINANFDNLYRSIASDAKSGALIDTSGISAKVVPVVMELVDDEIAFAVGQEEVERIAADQDLQERIDDEVTTRQAADTLIGEAIQQETTARQVADQETQEDLSTLESTLTQAIQSEASTRGSVDQVLQNQIHDVEDSYTALENRVGFAEQDIESIEDDVSNLSTDVSSLDTQVTGLSSSVTSLSSTVTNIASDVSDLSDDVSTLSSSVSTLQDDVQDISVEVTDVSTEVTLLQADVGDLDADLDAFKTSTTTSITNLGHDLVAEQTARAAKDTDLQNQINAISTPPDYVVAEGICDFWTYRMWNSGVAECWGKASQGTYSVTTSWGPIFEGPSVSCYFPGGYAGAPFEETINGVTYTKLFKEKPEIFEVGFDNTGGTYTMGFEHGPGRTDLRGEPCFILRATSGSVTGCYEYHAKGRWK